MDHSVPACSCRPKNPTLPGNRPDSELLQTTGTTVISTTCHCGHRFQLTCIQNTVSDEAAPCQNENCAQNVERKQLEEVNFETIMSSDAPSVSAANLEEVTDGSKLTEHTDDANITQITTDIIQLEEEITIESSQFERVEKENLKLIDENKKLRSRNEKCNETIRKLKLYKSKLKDVEQRNILFVNQNNELQSKNDEYVKTISELKEQNSKLETIEYQNSLLVDQIKGLQSKNDECMDIVKKLQRCIDTKAIDEIFTTFENELVNRENDQIRQIVPNIKTESNLDENVVVKEYYDDEETAQTLSSDESETDEEKAQTLSSNDTETDKVPEPLKVSSELDGQQVIPKICRSFSLSSQRASISRDLKMMEEIMQSKVEKCGIRENDPRVRCRYLDYESKKRTSYEAHRREYDYSPEKGAKRQKRNSSPKHESLRPFNFTGHKFGAFSQLIYDGEYAYASGEYLLLGDAIINGVLRTALYSNKYFAELIRKSPYYFSRKTIRRFVSNLENLPYLPNKVMISIGDYDTATNDRSYYYVKESLQSLFYTLYHKGVKKVVMIPPVKHKNWSDRRYHLDIFLRLQAGTRYDWDYYYMQELSEVMSTFTDHIQIESMYYILYRDIPKLSEKIVSYTTREMNEEAEAETVS